jgi:hypothetical protein
MSDASGFGKFVPGFEFLQNLAGQAAGGVAQGLGKSLPQMPNLGHWVAPTFNVEDLEKRIEELKAVQFWLDQNAKALSATIQALEVQKMSLATLKAMNFNLGDVANALRLKAVDTVSGLTGKAPTQFAGLEIPERTYGNPSAEAPPAAPVPAPEPAPKKLRKPAAKAAPAADIGSGVVDPMAWWGALSQQFQQIASTAMKDMAKQGALDATRNVASGLTEQAVKTATGMATKAGRSVGDTVGRAAGMGSAAMRAVTGAKGKPKAPAAAPKPAPKKARAAAPRKPAARASATPAAQPMGAGDWPLPTAFFPGFLPASGSAPAKGGASGRAPSRTAAKKTPARKTPRR